MPFCRILLSARMLLICWVKAASESEGRSKEPMPVRAEEPDKINKELINEEDLIMLPVFNRNTWMPEVFNDFFDNDFMLRPNATAPAINVKESDTEYTVELAAPGLKKDDFNVNIDNSGNLHIRMESKNEKKDEDKKSHYLRREFSYSKYEQTLLLPDDVDKEKIEAKVNDGVLTVSLPKVERKAEEALKRIEVK